MNNNLLMGRNIRGAQLIGGRGVRTSVQRHGDLENYDVTKQGEGKGNVPSAQDHSTSDGKRKSDSDLYLKGKKKSCLYVFGGQISGFPTKDGAYHTRCSLKGRRKKKRQGGGKIGVWVISYGGRIIWGTW